MDQRMDFQRRIGRVADRAGTQRSNLGPSKSPRMVRSERIQTMLERQDALEKEQDAYWADLNRPAPWTPFLAVILAFAIGAAAAMIASYMHFQLTGILGLNPSANLDFIVDALMAIALAFWMRELVSLSAVRHLTAQCAGILLALTTMHNVVHEMPGPFSRLFSAEWVEHVTDTTAPGTLIFQGHEIHI